MTDKLSDKRTSIFFVHSVIDDMDLTPEAFRIYGHLCRRANPEGIAWPSYQAMGDHCFKKFSDPVTRRKHAIAAVKELIDAGLVCKRTRTRTDNGNSSNEYQLVDPPLVSVETPPLVSVETPKDNPLEDTPLTTSSRQSGKHRRSLNKPPSEHQQMFDKICQIVGWDYHVITKEQQGQVAQTLGILENAEPPYTLNDLSRFGKEVWSKNYLWEVHKKRPTLSQLRAEIGKLRANAATIAQPTVLVVPEAAL